MKLYRTANGIFAEENETWYRVSGADWSALTSRDDLPSYLRSIITKENVSQAPDPTTILAPLANQEVWAAGVTYFRSRTARMEEAEAAGGGTFYDRVYEAPRPELFMKATPHRVVGPGAAVHIRSDSKWNVPEPELALVITPGGKLIGYTVGNDMSSRDIEGENPLYLPQAKVYTRACALGPCVLVTDEPLPQETLISIQISRSGNGVFSGETPLSQLKRSPLSLIEYLFRENTFPDGAILLTGTGIVPPDSFTLAPGDEIRITIEGIGTLVNSVD
ncbi:MAG: fumarylacetoacetate hydrolase family protein [Bryobacteraceae bacterium]